MSEHFSFSYEEVFRADFSSDNQVLIEDTSSGRAGRCRFCGRNASKVKFEKRAHAVPEFLGNKAIKSRNECDECNQLLGDKYEIHLARWCKFERAVHQVRGKKGVTKFEDPDRSFSVETKDGNQVYTIEDAQLYTTLATGKSPDTLEFAGTARTQSFILRNAALSLFKLACSICPESDLDEFQPTIDWIMERSEKKIEPLQVILLSANTDALYNPGHVVLYRKKNDIEAPLYWCVLAWSIYRMQFFIPFCPSDCDWTNSKSIKGFSPEEFFPYPTTREGVKFETKWYLFDWSSIEPIHDTKQFSVSIDKFEILDPN